MVQIICRIDTNTQDKYAPEKANRPDTKCAEILAVVKARAYLTISKCTITICVIAAETKDTTNHTDRIFRQIDIGVIVVYLINMQSLSHAAIVKAAFGGGSNSSFCNSDAEVMLL